VQGNAFEDEFKKLGGEVLIKDEIPTDRRDVRTDAVKIFALKPDLVAYSNFENMGLVAHELKVLGYNGAQVSVLMDESRIDQGQGAFEGTVLVQYAKPSSNFIDAYKKKFGKEPGITADSAYDALKIYAQVINEAGTDNLSKVNKVFSELKTYSGASGELTFDDKGGVTKPPVFYVVQGTKFVEYKNIMR
jgi:branched-chain amino acid transport system substrate-binding protein